MQPCSTDDRAIARALIHCVDLTCLTDDANWEQNLALCRQAHTPQGNVAALCLWPRFIKPAYQYLKQHANENAAPIIPLATVINFAGGNAPLAESLASISLALEHGAQEIDVVMPYLDFMAGKTNACGDYLMHCRQHCNQIATTLEQPAPLLKIILETGCLGSNKLIESASELAIAAGADFIKTSTGKTKVGATPDAVRIMANVIQKHHLQSGQLIGLKISGGIRHFAQAKTYYQFLCERWNCNMLLPHQCRIGASRLLGELVANAQ